MTTILITALVFTHVIMFLLGRGIALNKEMKKHLPNIKIEEDLEE